MPETKYIVFVNILIWKIHLLTSLNLSHHCHQKRERLISVETSHQIWRLVLDRDSDHYLGSLIASMIAILVMIATAI